MITVLTSRGAVGACPADVDSGGDVGFAELLAERWGYVRSDPTVVDRLDKIVATLTKLTVPRA